MRKPITLVEARRQQLLAKHHTLGVYTFSNGDEWRSWADQNCYECAHYDPDVAGLCAFEPAAFMHIVTPDLARLFGWLQDAQYDEPDDHRHGWKAPQTCPFLKRRNDDDRPPAPDPDPLQLVLIADPREDAGMFHDENGTPSDASTREAVTV